MTILEQAENIFDEVVKHRRQIHQLAETGFELPETSAYVRAELEKLGYEVSPVLEYGLSTTIGSGGKCILLRADMDALPMEEQSGLEFASTNGNAHACGHDLHTSVLLGVAKLLKDNEDKLEGTVKLFFQPAEELLIGCQKCIEEGGILENPKVDFAMAAHCQTKLPYGINYVPGTAMTSANNYRVTVKGQGSHGAMPHLGVDPVSIGTKIIDAYQTIISRELPTNESAALTTGFFEANGSRNILPDEAVLEGTMRTFSESTRNHLKERMPEVAKAVAQVFRGDAEFEFLSDCPSLYNDPEMSEKFGDIAREILVDTEFGVHSGDLEFASEDFAAVSQLVPTVYFFMGMQTEDENPSEIYPVHNPKVVFKEELMVPAMAVMLESTVKYLKGEF